MREEAIGSGFAPGTSAPPLHGESSPSGQALAKVDKVSNSVKVVLVLALEWRGVTAVVDDRSEKLGVADFLEFSFVHRRHLQTHLVGHELDQGNVIGAETRFGELFR